MTAPEAGSGLDPFREGQLPEPPRPMGLGWIAAVGPGVILLGASIGSGEFLLGPAVMVKYGLSLLWISGVAITLQTLFNTELMRYTIATGEPVFTGFMRTAPRAGFWAWLYSLFFLLQAGWPAWAGTAAGAVFFLFTKRLAGPEEANLVYLAGLTGYALCVGALLVGRRIERTLEILNWVLVTLIIGGLLVLAILFVPGATWIGGLVGWFGFDAATGNFSPVPAGIDWFLIGAFAAFSGAGGVINISLSNWARDKGYGMGSVAGYIPSAIGGERTDLAHTGFRIATDPVTMQRWKGWWRLVRADQYGVFFIGAVLGMLLPGLLYVTFVPSGEDIRGLAVASTLAHAVSGAKGAVFGGIIAMMAVWVLLKAQLDILEGTVRGITDILWAGSSQVRTWRGGDVRLVYYSVLGLLVGWGVIALRLAQPVVLLQISANVGGIVFVLASLHLLRINTTLLPPALRPPLWRRVALVTMALFYGAFVTLWLSSLR